MAASLFRAGAVHKLDDAAHRHRKALSSRHCDRRNATVSWRSHAAVGEANSTNGGLKGPVRSISPL
jgi:hypothetical protein